MLAVLSGKGTVQSLSEGIRREPKNPEFKIRLGMKYQERRLRDIALALFQEAASLDPEAKLRMALDNGEDVSCREMADYQFARAYGAGKPEYLEKFVRDYPSGRLVGDAYLDLTRFDGLGDKGNTPLFLKMMAARPHDPAVLERYVSKFLDSQDQVEVRVTLDRGLALAENTVRTLENDDAAGAAMNLAELWLLKGDPGRAEAESGPEFRLSLVRFWAASMLRYAEFWTLKNRNLEDAERAAALALSMCPDDASLRRRVARIYFFAPERPEKAIEVYGPTSLKRIESNAAELYEYFSFWSAHKMNGESAQGALEALLRLKPDSLLYRSMAAEAYLKAGQTERASNIFGPDFLARHPQEHSVLYDYGIFWIQKNANMESAVPALIKAIRESPRNWNDQLRAAMVLSRANKSPVILSVIGPDYLPHIKDDPAALCGYAQFWLRKNENLASALEAAQAACGLEKNSADVWSTLAELFLANAKPGEALAVIDKAMSLANIKNTLERCTGIKMKIQDALQKK
jgi:thioredoxin-like negative regulator of GroEL